MEEHLLVFLNNDSQTDIQGPLDIPIDGNREKAVDHLKVHEGYFENHCHK